MLVYVHAQVSAEHLHLIFLYQPHQLSFTTVYADVTLLFICLNVFAYINCKGNSVLTHTFPVEPHWLQNRLQSQPAFLFVEMAVIGARLRNAYGWSPGKTQNHTFISTRTHTSTPPVTLCWINIHISGVCYQRKGSCLSEQTEEQRKQERERWSPPRHLSFSLLLRWLPTPSEQVI